MSSRVGGTAVAQRCCAFTANDQVVSAVKHIRALRLYSANVKSAEDSRAARASAEKRVSLERDDRAPLPRSRDVEARGSVKEGPDSDESEEESQESSHHQCLAAKSDPARRPPEPAHPPRGHRVDEDRQRDRGAEEREPATSGKKRKKRDNRGNRAGKKHQRLHRALEDPSIRLHRRPPGHFWDNPDRISTRDQHQSRRHG